MRRVLVPVQIDDARPAAGAPLWRLDGETMGTTWSVQGAGGTDTVALRAAIEQELERLVGQMSHWQAGSELDCFNRAPAGHTQQLSPEFAQVLRRGLEIRDASGGAFDPCAGELVDLWGFGAHGQFQAQDFAPPARAAIDAALGRARAIAMDGDCAVQPGGVRLDLSGIAKGYAVDRLCALLEARGLLHHLVEIGGELRGAGMKPDGQPWWVELEEPGENATVLALHGLACATSGDYRRWFDYSGRRYAHTIDPRGGEPVANGVTHACAIAAACMDADAWATALTVLGPAQGIDLADRHGLAARVLTSDGREHTSAAFRAMLQ